MNYISELRKYIGHRPLINIGATVIVMNNKNEILLNLRSDTGTWGIIGGGMEPSEELTETVARELWEEAGLRAEWFELIDVLLVRNCILNILTVMRPILSLCFIRLWAYRASLK